MNHLLTFAELDENRWASCGPASLAALLHRPLSEIQRAFPHHTAEKTWTNLQMMDRALARLGVKHEHTGQDIVQQLAVPCVANPKCWPTRGLVIVQFVGSWSKLAVNHPAQLERSHWVAISPLLDAEGAVQVSTPPCVFDINLLDPERPHAVPSSAGWTTRKLWEERVAPVLARSYGPKATGAWWVRAGLEVRA